MLFNPDKCEVLRITNKKKPIQSTYNIHGVNLKRVETAKYLGLNINCHLSWNTHIDRVTKKANSTRAFLQRNLRGCPTNIKAQSYKTFVRPTLEYASVVWDPHTQLNTNKLEAVQRRSARFACNVYQRTSSVTPLLKELQWQPLRERRHQAKIIMTYKILHNLIDIPSSLYTQATLRATTRGHQFRLRQFPTRILAYQHSFFPSSVKLWNLVPHEVATSPTIDVVKAILAKTQLP